MNDQSRSMNQSQMLNRSYGVWPPPVPLPPPPEDPLKFQNRSRPGFVGAKPGRNNWKGKKSADKRKENRRIENVGIGGYIPPTLHELQSKNRLKARRFYPKKKFNRFAPFAPRNTTSFIIRAKKSGGIASLVSPCPVTPAILPTPKFSPSREDLVDTAKEEWGLDGYGSMNGLIRLRSTGQEIHDDEEDDEGGSSESDVEEHVEVERRLDHDLSRFEMIYPNCGDEQANMLENRVDDQDAHIAQLEEENLTLKEKLFLMERELGDLKMRLQCLETQRKGKEDDNDEASDNDGGGDICSEKDNEGGGGDICSDKSVDDGDGE